MKTEKKYAPFTKEEVDLLKMWQSGEFQGITHPFTCCSHDGCDRLKQPMKVN